MVLLAVGVLVLGAGLGCAGRSVVAPSADAPVEVDVVAAPADDTGGASRLPDVRGLALAAAQQAVAYAGLNPSPVTVVEVSSASPGGTVVGQDPVGGTSAASPVTLSVAVPGEVPALVAVLAEGFAGDFQYLVTATVLDVGRRSPWGGLVLAGAGVSVVGTGVLVLRRGRRTTGGSS
ncbi:PASTA domain-containing protein [Klenkia sp. PcliD-1-E]|uniref:PASTA domain-containing protein n=1 Tax=Klenkia sp. PcliD-1-E TaxID=2954492 RepID=UPI0020970960|nr:PASTA domain-containing protein [Klenkia sp. PcliD-1-E]MCO7219371.1 PASTA domain-containing protein [Klenkia sp. PcliD-1-E]